MAVLPRRVARYWQENKLRRLHAQLPTVADEIALVFRADAHKTKAWSTTKEALVVGGHLVTAAARRSGAPVLPIDSEHSAILQCLRGAAPEEVEAIWLTAVGCRSRYLSARVCNRSGRVRNAHSARCISKASRAIWMSRFILEMCSAWYSVPLLRAFLKA